MSTELRDLNARWFQAWLDKDAATVEELMSADYVYIAPRGVTLDRAAILNVIRSPTYRLDRFANSEIIVRALGSEAGIVRDRRQSSGSFDGADFTDDQRGVMVWAREAGEWRLVMEQCSFTG